jgi:hypothetical protein
MLGCCPTIQYPLATDDDGGVAIDDGNSIEIADINTYTTNDLRKTDSLFF